MRRHTDIRRQPERENQTDIQTYIQRQPDEIDNKFLQSIKNADILKQRQQNITLIIEELTEAAKG